MCNNYDVSCSAGMGDMVCGRMHEGVALVPQDQKKGVLTCSEPIAVWGIGFFFTDPRIRSGSAQSADQLINEVIGERSMFMLGMLEITRSSRTLSVAVLVMALTCVFGACCPSARADGVLAANYGAGRIDALSLGCAYTGPFISGLGNPIAILQGGDGNIYVGGPYGVAKYGPDGVPINESLIPAVSMVTDLAWKDNKLWLTDYAGLTAAYDPVTGAQSGPSIDWRLLPPPQPPPVRTAWLLARTDAAMCVSTAPATYGRGTRRQVRQSSLPPRAPK
jgi:hypothetical protein